MAGTLKQSGRAALSTPWFSFFSYRTSRYCGTLVKPATLPGAAAVATYELKIERLLRRSEGTSPFYQVFSG
jgi:hypothetical protein